MVNQIQHVNEDEFCSKNRNFFLLYFWAALEKGEPQQKICMPLVRLLRNVNPIPKIKTRQNFLHIC